MKTQSLSRRVGLRTAFTIIELLVVIAIIALLTGIIMTNLTGSKARARDAKRVSDMGNMQVALELYYDRCKQYPNDANNDYKPDIDANNGCPVGINFGSFIASVPTNPLPRPTGEGDYEYSKEGSAYVLRVVLEEKNAALQDDIDVTPANPGWPSSLDLGTACEDANQPYQYCLVSN